MERPDEEVLEAYSQTFAKQMQQSVFGQLADELGTGPDDTDEVINTYQFIVWFID